MAEEKRQLGAPVALNGTLFGPPAVKNIVRLATAGGRADDGGRGPSAVLCGLEPDLCGESPSKLAAPPPGEPSCPNFADVTTLMSTYSRGPSVLGDFPL